MEDSVVSVAVSEVSAAASVAGVEPAGDFREEYEV